MTVTRRALFKFAAMVAALKSSRVAAAGMGQPRPTRTRVVRLKLSERMVTAVMRHWRPGESGKGGRCQLCEECVAYGDGCLVIIDRHVDRRDAPLLTLKGTRLQDNPA